MVKFHGVKVFSATKARDRETLGEEITRWIKNNDVDVVDRVIRQSSDSEYHCLTVILFYVHWSMVPGRGKR